MKRFLTHTSVQVNEGERNRGRGLLEAMHDWARSVELELLLVSPSDRSVPFYQRAGFRSAGDWLRSSLESSRTATE